MPSEDILEEYARALEASDDYRVLRRLQPVSRYHPDPEEDKLIGVFADIETTGLDPGTDKIIELAMVRFEFLPDGRIFRILDEFSAFADPGFPLPEGIVHLTGITDAMVQGRSIDAAQVQAFLDSVALVIAHNAAFDRVFLESAFPVFETKAWACSMKEIPWAEEGCTSAKLEYLAWRQGFFFDGHRALTDCLAGLHLLSMALLVSGEPTLKVLLDRARQREYRLWAQGSPFDAKEILKARGYRWSPGTHHLPRAWYIDLPSEKVKEEIRFLQQQIYGTEVELRIDVLTAFNRYSGRVLA
jgi:DNA polymerase III subunit epsilon